MQIANPLKYTDVSQEEFDQFKLLAKGKGLNLTGNKDTEDLDGIGITTEYSPDSEELQFTVHVPIWMPEATAVGIIHLLVAGAKAQADALKAEKQGGKDAAAIRQPDAADAHNAKHGHPVQPHHAAHHTTSQKK